MFSKLKTIFKPNKVMNKSIDDQLRESYPANVEGTNEFNESLENLNLDIYDLDRLFNDPLVVGWLSNAEQQLLFTLVSYYHRPNESVLDIGCGRGDLYGYLQERNPNETIKYAGVDYNPNMIEIARKKWPGITVVSGDGLNLERTEEYDWVMASGTLNLKDSEDMFEYGKQLVDVMYSKCKRGVAFNILTDLPDDVSDSDRNALFVHDPAQWLDHLLKTYSKVICRTDYMLGDCTFYIFK